MKKYIAMVSAIVCVLAFAASAGAAKAPFTATCSADGTVQLSGKPGTFIKGVSANDTQNNVVVEQPIPQSGVLTINGVSDAGTTAITVEYSPYHTVVVPCS